MNLNRMLKIGVLGAALLLLTGCSKTKNKTEGPNDTVQPTNGAESQEPTNGLDSSNENQVTTYPQGDGAEDVIITLDPGHGGGFSGAHYEGRSEKDLTLKVANYVKAYLEENYIGVKIHMTREKDSALSGDVKEDLELRAQSAQDANADAVVSIHFNASNDHNQNGAMVLISHRDNVADVSEDLANSILTELSNLGLKNHGTQTRNSNDMFDENGKPLDYYAVNRHCANRDIPGIIVEHCFMDNTIDQGFLDSEEDLKALAKADAIGIANYFGFSPK